LSEEAYREQQEKVDPSSNSNTDQLESAADPSIWNGGEVVVV